MLFFFCSISNILAKLVGFEGDSIVLDDNGAKVNRDNVLNLVTDKLLMILNSQNPESIWRPKSFLEAPIIIQDVSIEATSTLPIESSLEEAPDTAVSNIPWHKLRDYDEELFTFLEGGGSYTVFNRPGSTGYVIFSN